MEGQIYTSSQKIGVVVVEEEWKEIVNQNL